MKPQRWSSSFILQNLVDTILDTIIDGVVTIDKTGEIQSFNRAAADLFGYEPEEVIGQNVKILMPEPYRAEHDAYISNYNETGEAKIIGIGREVTGQRKDGSIFPMELSVGAAERGDKHAFIGIIRDITERKEAEKAREQLRQAQKMEALGQLTGGLAHDFNNLLAVILGNLDFMYEKTDENHPLREYILPSIQAAEHGSELTQRLLAFGRKQTLQPRLVDVNELIGNISMIARRTLGERVEVVLSLDSEIGDTVVDPRQLENALLNLSINARDAMPKGGKIIFETKNVYLDADYADAQSELTPGEYVLIAVSDTGAGMSPEVMAKAFDPFFTTKGVGKGSGLGLSMVYGFVKQSKGHIKLYSEIGHGTTVKIYLPRSDAPTGQDRKKETPRPLESGKKAKTVLVVEDNPNVLKLTAAMTESLGYNILTAPNGAEAMKILQNPDVHIDLLLTDVMLPGDLNGPALAARAAEIRPNMRVLFNSGYAEHAIFQAGLLQEGMHLLEKPFRKPQLAEKIELALKS